MLITCFQCRQQLDVPDDSAGKRVRCPHCQYVIVVPSAPKAAGTEGAAAPEPMTALPSMDLDVGAEPVATKIAAQPLPPIPPTPIPATVPAAEAEKPKPKYDDELPPLPPIDRPTRRRVPMTPLKKPGAPWGKILGFGAIVLLVLVAVIVAVVSSRSNRPRMMAKNMQPNFQFNPNNFPFNPNLPMNQAMVLPWQDFVHLESRFKARFPNGAPMPNNQNIHGVLMTGFETNFNGWMFAIFHRAMTEKEFLQRPIPDRFQEIKQHYTNVLNAPNPQEMGLPPLGGAHEGRHWSYFSQVEGRWCFVRAYFVRDGQRYHEYILTAKGPMNVFWNNPDITHFFNSFQAPFGAIAPAPAGSGQTFYEERDDLNRLDNPPRRDSEFTALAVHPNKPVAAIGTVDGNVCVKSANVDVQFIRPRDGNQVRQLAASPDGQWLAAAVNDEIVLWRDWDQAAVKLDRKLPGASCQFTKNQRLLVASTTEVKEYDYQNKANLTATLPIADFPIAGFALSADQQTLALFGDTSIQLWNWPQKRMLGKIDAHDAAITAVAFSSDGKTLASASADRWIRLWNVDTREERSAAQQHAWTVWSLAFTPDGEHLVSGGLDGMVLVWNVQPAELRLVAAESHQFPVRSVAFDAGGKHLYMTCKHPVANEPVVGRKWERQVRKIGWSEFKQNSDEARKLVAYRAGLRLPGTSGARGSLQMSPDGKTIITVDDPNAIQVDTTHRVWDAATATVRHTFPGKPLGFFTPQGDYFLFLGPRSEMQLLDMKTLTVGKNALAVNANNTLPQFAFTPEGKSVWIEQLDEFRHYQLPDFKLLQPPLRLKQPQDRVGIYPSLDRKSFLVETFPVAGLQRKRAWHASADGKFLAPPKAPQPGDAPFVRLRRDVNGFIQLEDILSGTNTNIGQQRNPFSAGTVSRDLKFGATGEARVGQFLHVNLWDLRERHPLLTLPESGAHSSLALRFSADGKQLAIMTNAAWSRLLPTDWLLERQGLLACNANDVAAP